MCRWQKTKCMHYPCHADQASQHAGADPLPDYCAAIMLSISKSQTDLDSQGSSGVVRREVSFESDGLHRVPPYFGTHLNCRACPSRAAPLCFGQRSCPGPQQFSPNKKRMMILAPSQHQSCSPMRSAVLAGEPSRDRAFHNQDCQHCMDGVWRQGHMHGIV